MYPNEASSNFTDVGRFHRKFGLKAVSSGADCRPQEVPDDLRTFRAKFILEEFMEYLEGAGLILTSHTGTYALDMSDLDIELDQAVPVDIDHAKMFDALLDIVYVAMGTAHIEGYPWEVGWDEVQKANMAKERAKPDGSNSVRQSAWDIVKPKGWTAPDIAGILRKFGWKI